MRLAQLRDWLAGQGWFDLSQQRVARGYESHWSRLIDAGLAGTLWLFGWFAEPAMAERLMRAHMADAVAAARDGGHGRDRVAHRGPRGGAGRAADGRCRACRRFTNSVPAASIITMCRSRLSVLVVAATVWSDRVRWAAWVAGAVTGLALAIGLEGLPYLMVCAAAFAVRYVVDPKNARAACRLWARARGKFARGIHHHRRPGSLDARRLRRHRDQLASVGGDRRIRVGAGRALRKRAAMPVRFASVLVVGAAAIALFAAIEPRCLRGPYAMIDPAVWPVWLATCARCSRCSR